MDSHEYKCGNSTRLEKEPSKVLPRCPTSEISPVISFHKAVCSFWDGVQSLTSCKPLWGFWWTVKVHHITEFSAFFSAIFFITPIFLAFKLICLYWPEISAVYHFAFVCILFHVNFIYRILKIKDLPELFANISFFSLNKICYSKKAWASSWSGSIP